MSSALASRTVWELLAEAAAKAPERPAVIFRGRALSFAALVEDSERLSRGLLAAGVGRGTRTVLMVPPGPDFFALTFALFKAGAVPVLVDPGMGWKNLGLCLSEAEPEAFIGSPKAHLARIAGGWGKETLKVTVSAGGPWLGGYSLSRLRALGELAQRKEETASPPRWIAGALPSPSGSEVLRYSAGLRPAEGGAGCATPEGVARGTETALSPRRTAGAPVGGAGGAAAGAAARETETAAILFTSGSTGPPKGAVYTSSMFSAQVELLSRIFEIKPGEVSVATFPLFGLFDAALGMSVVVPRMDAARPARADPREILGPIREHGAAQLFGSPALLDAVGRYAAEHGMKLPSLKRVLSAGAPVPARTIERFRGLLSPGARIYTPYGATEALPVCLIEAAEILSESAALADPGRASGEGGGGVSAASCAAGRGVCVGREVPGVEASVIRISDEAIASWSEGLRVADGEVGEIVVRGPVVSPRYYGRPEATALSKMRGPAGELYHRMGDLGCRDAQGRLWFCGRKSQRVRTLLGELYTIPCERVFNRHPKVRRSALVGVGAPGTQVPVLCVELEKGAPAAEQEAIKAELLVLGAAEEHTRRIAVILFHPEFPVDIRHNAKIFREKLAEWASRRIR